MDKIKKIFNFKNFRLILAIVGILLLLIFIISQFISGRQKRKCNDLKQEILTIVDKYVADEYCNFIFTLNAYYNMFTGISRLYNKKLLSQMPKSLPVFFVAGEDDPVGDFGKGVLKAVDMFKNTGMQNVKVKLYPTDRHEILNETDFRQVYDDLYT